MNSSPSPLAVTDASTAALLSENRQLRQQVTLLQQRIDWFTRQLFGLKSERFVPESNPLQLHLGEVLPLPETPPAPPQQHIPAHTRRVAAKDLADGDVDRSFFDEARLPIETITLHAAEAEGLLLEQYTVIGEKVSHRLAQRPGSYVILGFWGQIPS